MSFDPNTPVQAPEPSQETGAPGEPGAVGGIPQPQAGETAAGAEQVSGDDVVARLETENRRLQRQVGLLTQELGTRYDAPPAGSPAPGPAYPPAHGAAAPPGASAQPVPFSLREEIAAKWEEYGVDRGDLASFAQEVVTETVRRVMPVAQQLVVGGIQAHDLSNRFYAQNEDLAPYRQHFSFVAREFMLDSSRAQGRTFEQCLPEIANELRVRIGLPARSVAGTTAPIQPRETARVEAAQTAPGGSTRTGGGVPKASPKEEPAPKSPAEEYIEMHTQDHTKRILGGTRLGRKALGGTKVS